MNTPGKPTNQLGSFNNNPFTRAIVEIGGTTAKQASQIPGQMVNDAMTAIFGGGSSPASSNETSNQQTNSDNPFAKAMEQNKSFEEQQREANLNQQRAVMHKEYQMTEVFNLQHTKDEETIKQLQEQLRMLAKEVKSLDSSAQTAIFQDVVDPSAYHVTFFQKLLNFIVLLRKRVQDANTWIENFNSRHKKQGSFWGQVYNKKGGTAYLMSQEHQVARNVG